MASAGASQRPERPEADGERRARSGRDGRRHGTFPTRGREPDGRRRARAPRMRVAARGRDVADVELEQFEAAEAPARQPRHDVEPVALVDDLGDVRSTERDAVEDIALAPQRQLAVPARRGADARDGQAEHGHQRVGVARDRTAPGPPARGRGRSRPRSQAAPGRSRSRRADPAARSRRRAAGSARGRRPSARSGARSRPPRRGRRSG